MNLEFYKNFIAMVEAGGMNRAAREIHVAQPALTRQLQTMEKEYGAALVKPRKGRHSLELTEAGWVLYRQAKQMYEAEEHARTEIGSLAAGLKGTVRISLSPSLSPWMIKKVICPFHERHREITFRIRESYQLPLIEEVRRGISEIGVVNAPLPDPSLFRILKRTGASLAVIGKDDHPLLVSHERVKPEELCPFPVAVSRSTDEVWNRLCREKGLPSHPLASLDSRASAVLFAKSGMALSVVVWNEGEIAPEGLLCRPLEDHSFNPSITCFTLRGHVLSGGMERFVNFMEL